MLYLTKNQIRALVERVGAEKAMEVLRDHFNSYKYKLSSFDVKDVYDEGYLKIIENHPPYKIIKNSLTVHMHSSHSFSYILEKSKDSARLDIGCENCNFILALSIYGYKCTGMDFSEESIKQGKGKMKALNLKASLICENLNIFDTKEVFDFITLNDVVEHLSDEELIKLFKKIESLLSPKEGKL